MHIYYSQILNRESKKILAGEYSGVGQALKSDSSLLKQLRSAVIGFNVGDTKVYTFRGNPDKYAYYLQAKDGLILSVIADASYSAAAIGRFLKEMGTAYESRFKDNDVTHYEFDMEIRSISDSYNKSSKLNKGVEELEGVHNILVENLDTIINRGENINNLKNLADKINLDSMEMSRKVSQIRRKAQLEKYKVYAILLIVICVVIYLFMR